MKRLFKLFLTTLFLIGLMFGLGWYFLGPVENKDLSEMFTVTENQNKGGVITKLKEQKLIKNNNALGLLLTLFAKDKQILAGGYSLNKNMNAWQVLQKITDKPDFLWVTIHGCSRKEEVGEILARVLGWDQNKQELWIKTTTETKSEYTEGVYYPDTYLIPVNESPDLVAKRLINRFNEKINPLLDKFAAEDIKWTTGVKIASLIAREAAGMQDMNLISGIIWNRLNKGMLLQIDATMQYTLGKKANGFWWGTIDLAEKLKGSPYNTYLYKGLPPTSICSPQIAYIEAVLNPEETDCLFYLHDHNKEIHCAKTYEEHKANIKKYL